MEKKFVKKVPEITTVTKDKVVYESEVVECDKYVAPCITTYSPCTYVTRSYCPTYVTRTYCPTYVTRTHCPCSTKIVTTLF